MDNLNEMARLHSAGATVRHASDFEGLASHKNDFELPDEFISKWVVPFYMKVGAYNGIDWIEPFKKIKEEATRDVSLALLGEFNWRPRAVGAYLAAANGYTDLIDVIGVHLLKSEVCCVGHIYALTLSFFNTEKSIHYFNAYLDYYLRKPDLDFDQERVLQAVMFLDKTNGTNNLDKHYQAWLDFEKEKEVRAARDRAALAGILANMDGSKTREEHHEALLESVESIEANRKLLNTEYFDEHIAILKEIRQP